MNELQNLSKKKILIYGFGKSGYASFKFLNKNNFCKIIDDDKKKIPDKFKKKVIDAKKLRNFSYDFIVVSPGIDIKKCKISSFLRKYKSKIITDLDIFQLSYPRVRKITITGTNGKSTTSKLLYNVLKADKFDVRLTGNIGHPILLEKKITQRTVFVIEASSYQLDYSKFFNSKYAAILNISPDHIERHGNLKNYLNAKFKLFKNQKKGDTAFVDINNKLLNNLLKKNKPQSKIKKINYKKYLNKINLLKNTYFNNLSNIKNLSFVFEISKVFNVKSQKVMKTANKFKGLDYRQQIIYDSKYLRIINDSKSTSLSSTIPLLETYKNIYWLLGGQSKKGDNFNLNKKYFNKIKAYIYGKKKTFFKKILSNKIINSSFDNLNHSLKQIFDDIEKENYVKKILLFSPAAASFDQFKNFEERGKYFNRIIKKYLKKYNE